MQEKQRARHHKDRRLQVTSAVSPLLLVVLYVSLALAPLILAALSSLESAGFWTEAASAAGMVGAVMMLLQLVSSGRFEWLSPAGSALTQR